MKRKLAIIALILFLTFGIISNGVCQWVQTGPYGGGVTCFVVNDTNIFAGTNGGVFLSTNTGSSWSPINTGLTYSRIIALVASDNGLFAATDNGGGVFHTTNNGKNWVAVSNGWFTDLTALGIKDTNLFAGTYGGRIYRSTNNGGNWNGVVNIGYLGATCFATNSNNIFVGTDSGVWRSTDDGITWSGINIGLTSHNITSLATTGANLFAGTQDSGIFLSINNGANWHRVKSGFTLSLFASGNNIFAGAQNGPLLSTDNGTNWIKIDSGFTNFLGDNVKAFASVGTSLFAGTGMNGIFLSTNNGTSWSAINSGLSVTDINTIAVNGSTLFTGTFQNGFFRSTDDGINWDSMNTGIPILREGQGANVLATNGANIFAAEYDKVYISSNNGLSWTLVNDSLYSIFPGDGILNAFALNGSNLFVGHGLGVSLTTNNGQSWIYLNGGLAEDVLSLAIGEEFLYAGTSSGEVFRTDKNGGWWTNVNPSFAQQGYIIYSLVASGTNVIAGTYNGVFFSSDQGIDWSATYTNSRVYSLASIGANIFAGTEKDGIYFSSDGGLNWQQFNTGLTASEVHALSVTDKYLYAGTYSCGVWRRPLSDFGISDVKNQPQPDLSLSLSPNPTTGIITVHNAPANLLGVSILNVLGQTVLDLPHPNAPEFTLDLSKLPPGTYFARFAVEDEVITRKILKE